MCYAPVSHSFWMSHTINNYYRRSMAGTSVVSKFNQGKPKGKKHRQQRRAPELTQSDLSEFVKVVRQLVEEDQGREANHRSESKSPKDFERKPRLNLPPAAHRRWTQMNEDLNTILDNTLKGDAAKKINTMAKVVYQA